MRETLERGAPMIQLSFSVEEIEHLHYERFDHPRAIPRTSKSWTRY
jgi:hypothetical protein